MAYTHVRFTFRQDGAPSIEHGSGDIPVSATPEAATGWVRPTGSKIIGVAGAILGDEFIWDGAAWDAGLNSDSTFQDAASPEAIVSEVILAPVLAAVDAIHALYATGVDVNFPGAWTPPDVPRNVTVSYDALYDGGDTTVTGTDVDDNMIVEVFTNNPGATVTGTKVFKTVTAAVQAAIGAGGVSASIGHGTKLGLLRAPLSPTGLLSADGVNEVGTFDNTADSWGVIPTNLPNGARNYEVTYAAAGATSVVTATP
jgi:hypothetical protein